MKTQRTAVFKTADKAAADAQMRQYYWSLTPEERLRRALRLRERARAIRLANPANTPLPIPDGRCILKADHPIERRPR